MSLRIYFNTFSSSHSEIFLNQLLPGFSSKDFTNVSKSNISDYVIDQINVERSSLLNVGLSPKEIDKKAPIYLSFLKINNQEIPFKTTSKDKRIQGSCVLINNELKHRVLINKNTSKNKIYEYSLFSCYIDEKEYCNFEENNK